MSNVRYVTLDPTGNITCLVTDLDGAEESAVTARLMQKCEQVAYLEPPTLPGSNARIRLMGGEFCGNAAMASACWLADQKGLGEEPVVFPIEMSGAEGLLNCTVRRLQDGFEGTVPMPSVRSVEYTQLEGLHVIAVHFEGISHLIYIDGPISDSKKAEAILKRISEKLDAPAVGLLQWDTTSQFMRPLVYVRGSNTMVWETGCGSGSAAIGAYYATLVRNQMTIAVRQPGGTILASANGTSSPPDKITITGTVHFGPEQILAL